MDPGLAEQAKPSTLDWGVQSTLAHLLPTVLYVSMGLLFFALAFWLMCKIAPFSVRKEIEEDQNISLGIVMGAVILGIAIIVAAAIHG
ncbi:MAG: DUF350 domain-containing protein [Planctomycetes bacterium]|nr:DUF350 domain-containing protein [Planctomycetota bacterium]